jgi:Fuc2NAc and GlcNAc transferase
MIGLLVAATVFFAVAALTGIVRRLALRHELIDVPNQRSSHQAPTPRGGGLAIVAVVVVAWLLAAAAGTIALDAALVLSAAGLIVAAVGFVDDRGHVAARWRFVVQLLAACIVTLWTGGLGYLAFAGQVVEIAWFGAVLAVLGIIWMINLFNFMDGIDGIAGVEAVTVAFGAALVLWLSGHTSQALLMLVVGAASLGFLAWNWPPAKIFMGDVGSSFLGFVLGSAAIATHAEGSLDIWVWLVLLGVFVVDATLTLIRRVLRGERFYEAHRSHAYQHAARRLGSHRAVTLAVAAINILWLLPIAWLIESGRIAGIYGFLIAYVPLVWLAVANRAGRSEISSN